jgi:hypothetical protein
MASNSKENSIQNDLILNGILRIVDNTNGEWSGTMTELGSALAKALGRKNSNVIPGSPGALRVVINRVVNRIRNRSVSVRFGRTPDHTRTRYVRFSR